MSVISLVGSNGGKRAKSKEGDTDGMTPHLFALLGALLFQQEVQQAEVP